MPLSKKTIETLSRLKHSNDSKQQGFTLVEVLIVIGIVAILVAIALPSYRAQVAKGNRAAAQSFMLELANKEERYLLDARSYTDSISALGWAAVPSTVAANYSVSITLQAGPPPGYTITATPTTAQGQADRQCGSANLTLSSTGAKTPTTQGCW